VVGSVVEPILDDVIDELEDEGATVIDPTDIDMSGADGELAALLCEFKTDIATYLDTYANGTNPVTGAPYPQNLTELIAFNEAHPELEGPWNNLIFELANATNGRDQACADIRAGVTPVVQAAIDRLMDEQDLDAIVGLTNGPAWPTNDDPTQGDLDGRFGEFFISTSGAAAVSGYADITVPAAFVRETKCKKRSWHSRHGGDDDDDDRRRCKKHSRGPGLPVGITFIGGRWDEPKLLGFAYDFEQATEVRERPQFIPTIGDELFLGIPNTPAPEPEEAQAQQQAQQQVQQQAQQKTIHRRNLDVRGR
jgi:amidase